MTDLDVKCCVCQAVKGQPCTNPCTGELRPEPCIGRVERRITSDDVRRWR